MIACEIDINTAGFIFRANMLGLFLDKASGICTVSLNPRLSELYETGFTRIECNTRKNLSTDLAKWLHGFVLSHRANERSPQRLSVAALQSLTGATTELKDFRRKLKHSLNQLHELGVLASWRITENDALEFIRK
jgi:hypothetical protein